MNDKRLCKSCTHCRPPLDFTLGWGQLPVRRFLRWEDAKCSHPDMRSLVSGYVTERCSAIRHASAFGCGAAGIKWEARTDDQLAEDERLIRPFTVVEPARALPPAPPARRSWLERFFG